MTRRRRAKADPPRSLASRARRAWGHRSVTTTGVLLSGALATFGLIRGGEAGNTLVAAAAYVMTTAGLLSAQRQRNGRKRKQPDPEEDESGADE